MNKGQAVDRNLVVIEIISRIVFTVRIYVHENIIVSIIICIIIVCVLIWLIVQIGYISGYSQCIVVIIEV